ncbi:helix-turn-helix domain-containing protein [Arthrobacter sp. Leaf69]|uniref:helix-turn-helix domain-containing protein n=1 Tax=Arthrobacter sp. Leaf69 TaxID=1736232 RepID=UPI002E152527
MGSSAAVDSRNYVSKPFQGIGVSPLVTRHIGAANDEPGGAPHTFLRDRSPPTEIRSADRLVEGGEPVAQLARDFGISRTTIAGMTARSLSFAPYQPPQQLEAPATAPSATHPWQALHALARSRSPKIYLWISKVGVTTGHSNRSKYSVSEFQATG